MTVPPAPPTLDRMLCFALYSANLAVGRVYQPLLAATGLTYLQYLVMVALWNRDDRTVGELCAATFLATSTLTPVLQKLESKALVTRSRRARDGREVHIALTEAGQALAAIGATLPDCIQDATGLDRAATEALAATLAELRDRMGVAATRSD